jgi:hypothetical protein
MTSRTTTVKYVGRDKTPVVVLDNVLEHNLYRSIRDHLRSRVDFFGGFEENEVTFPGKIAILNRSIVDSLLDVMLSNKPLLSIYSRSIFEDKEMMSGFATILCSPGRVHHDIDEEFVVGSPDLVAPAAVFHFGFDGIISNAINTSRTVSTKTGTAIYREKVSGLERLSSISGIEEAFCNTYPDSVFCAMDNCRGCSSINKFEETHRVLGVPNRLVVYPKDLLHNTWVENEHGGKGGEGGTLRCSPKESRLAISLFFVEESKQICHQTEWPYSMFDPPVQSSRMLRRWAW